MSLTQMLRKIIEKSALSRQEIASQLGKSYHSLVSELSGQPRYKLSADLVLPIMTITRNYEPMDYLSKEIGGVFLKHPSYISTDDHLHLLLISSIKEFGEFAAESADSISDGIITKSEFQRMEKESQEAVTAIISFRAIIRELYKNQYTGYKRKNASVAPEAFPS